MAQDRDPKDEHVLYEVEVKSKVDGLGPVKERLDALGFVLDRKEDHSDVYLAHPVRDFASTDEALRLRTVEMDGKVHMLLTYKGPKVDQHTKTREEVNVEVKGDALRLLENNGYRPAMTIQKVRTVYRRGDIEVCLDEVTGLGTFVEVECQSQEVDGARAKVMGMAQQLGLGVLERRSYLELLLDKRTAIYE